MQSSNLERVPRANGNSIRAAKVSLSPPLSFCFRRAAALSRTETKLGEGMGQARLWLLENVAVVLLLSEGRNPPGEMEGEGRGKEGGRDVKMDKHGKEGGRPRQTIINLGCCLYRVAFLDLSLSLSLLPLLLRSFFFWFLPSLAIRSRQGLLCCPAYPLSRLLAGTTSPFLTLPP
ncbi:hypothetical protein BDP81DRAFT_52198 [Colletotrichum phormii]|uniref:Uncharacterized protein n=1 Tax=Colletotrichum phormii TaxID=359342 RepID=A0AAI9ZMJ5_9PEZI|nr:uncharacterized protein BDP81DRAFT_52198 [Colletotrichum phormii]KAK1634730.1 hypothetical protein BDP81DRAFT_52198 [Colletotrichum phormii]